MCVHLCLIITGSQLGLLFSTQFSQGSLTLCGLPVKSVILGHLFCHEHTFKKCSKQAEALGFAWTGDQVSRPDGVTGSPPPCASLPGLSTPSWLPRLTSVIVIVIIIIILSFYSKGKNQLLTDSTCCLSEAWSPLSCTQDNR